jgi:hypothetical protein
MNKRIRLTLYLACTVLLSAAQQGWKFHPSIVAGFDGGQLGSYGQIRSTLAFTHGPWSIGPGVAIDYYRYRTIPVFLSGTRHLSAPQSRNVFFLYGEAGFDLPWYYPDTHPWDYYTSKFRVGSWLNAGPGLRVRLSRRRPEAILLTAGYTIKNVKETKTARQTCPTPNSCAYLPDVFKYSYISHLLTFAIGFRF